ncbi:MAG: hypothetical protein AB7F98_12820 [Novosphingobium sp.]
MKAHLSLALLTLAACSVKTTEGQDEAASGEANALIAPSGSPATISCALAGAKEFKDQCGIERFVTDGKHFIVLRHPDGGFRRIEEVETGKRYRVLDGADEVAVDANGADVEVTVGDDHYLFPSLNPSNAPQL